jgi:hypothetical protein
MANATRLHGAQVKRDLAAGRVELLEIVDDPLLQNMRLVDFLMALPGIGEQKADRELRRAGVSPTRRLRNASVPTVRRVLAELGRD